MTERRTIAQWCYELNRPDAELTLSEFMAKCLLDLRENGVVHRLASEHVEGMLGTFDEMMAETNPTYAAAAVRRGRANNVLTDGDRSERMGA